MTGMGDGGSRVWIPVVFFALAAWFFLGSGSAVPPIAATKPFDHDLIVSGPRRTPLMADPPTIMIGGYEQRCSACHSLFESPPETERELLQHADIHLNHGMNNRCFNCHARQDRNKLALQGTREIGFKDAVLLCAKCHGPTYRDWQKGMHGRTTGSWIGPAEGQVRLTCVQCHDPHSPAFPSFAPLPGPNTLRMGSGPRQHEASDPDRISPLLRWQGQAYSPSADSTPASPEGPEGEKQ